MHTQRPHAEGSTRLAICAKRGAACYSSKAWLPIELPADDAVRAVRYAGFSGERTADLQGHRNVTTGEIACAASDLHADISSGRQKTSNAR
jgi:hypothetical protein